MGYTTEFNGAVNLSRELTLAEAKYLLEMNDDSDVTQERFGMRNYLQWVPAQDLKQLVWDGNEKFYDYVDLLRKVCDWLRKNGIEANGQLLWFGEDRSDRGTITVSMGIVSAVEGAKTKIRAGAPLTLNDLGDIALRKATEGI